MATLNQAAFLRENRDLIQGPALIVGSAMYVYDDADLRAELAAAGVTDVIGIDIAAGDGVDEQLDICEADDFVARHRGEFGTVLCMEMITHVRQPFTLGANVTAMLKPGGSVFLSECAVRKLSRMPEDHWRFTYTGIQLLFPDLQFHDPRARVGYTRQHEHAHIWPYDPEGLPEITDARHPDESVPGWYVRRLHKKLLAKGIFDMSRLMPELFIASVATKPAPPAADP